MTNLTNTARQGRMNALARLNGGNARSRTSGAASVTFMSVRGRG